MVIKETTIKVRVKVRGDSELFVNTAIELLEDRIVRMLPTTRILDTAGVTDRSDRQLVEVLEIGLVD